MSQLNDISLVAQVVVFKNTRAFDQLVKEYQSPIRRFFLNLTCGDSELSDDLAQDTFIKAYTNIASFRNLSSFSTWLYRIAYNVFYDYLKTYWMLYYGLRSLTQYDFYRNCPLTETLPEI